MTIHVYVICRNEEIIMPYFLRHYSTFADYIGVYDDQSTDHTREIVATCSKAELMDYPFDTGLDDEAFLWLWKLACGTKAKGVADWVICVDADEFVYHPTIRKVLADIRAHGYRVVKCVGYHMVSEKLPTHGGQIYDEPEFQWGNHGGGLDKAAVYDPTVGIRFTRGRHRFHVSRGVKVYRADVKLLHYGNLSLDYRLERVSTALTRSGEEFKVAKYGPDAPRIYTRNSLLRQRKRHEQWQRTAIKVI